MKIRTITSFLENYFNPIPVIQAGSPESCIADSLDYFNSEMGTYDYVEKPASTIIDLTEERCIQVVDVMPYNPSMTDLGGGDYSITDLILINFQAGLITRQGRSDMTTYLLQRDFLSNYRSIMAMKFRSRFLNGKLLSANIPSGTQSFYIIFIRSIDAHPFDPDYDIKDLYAYRWIKDYSLALYKMRQGEILAKATAVDLDVGGDNIKEEGKQEKKALQEELKNNRPYTVII